MALGTWGDVVFEVHDDVIRTWREAKRSAEARWHDHTVYGGKPRTEFLGPGADEITFSVRLDAQHGTDPETEVADLRMEMNAGNVYPLVIGNTDRGDFVLKALSEGWKRTDKGGNLTLIEVELRFKEYVA